MPPSLPLEEREGVRRRSIMTEPPPHPPYRAPSPPEEEKDIIDAF